MRQLAWSLSSNVGTFVLCLGIVGSCNDGITSADLLGVWGGEHIGLVVTESGASVEYDCAHGTIDGPLVPDNEGRFEASGVYISEHGGPVIEGESDVPRPARYAGKTDGRTMVLSVTFVDTAEQLGTFSLSIDTPPRVFKCL